MKMPKIPFTFKVVMGAAALIPLCFPWEHFGERGWFIWLVRLLSASTVWDAIAQIRKFNKKG